MNKSDKQGNQNKQNILEIPIDEIVPSRYQPRIHFDEKVMEELKQSISESGLIQPVTVRRLDSGGFELIAGERRWRACKSLGLKTISCYVITPTSEEQAATMALVENVQRENLSAIEEAKSYLVIMKQSGMTQEQLAEKIGKSQSSIANKIRLLHLPDEIQQGVVEGKITERHARALLNVDDDKKHEVYQHIVDYKLNVSATEQYIQKLQQPKKEKRRNKTKGYSRNIKIGLNSVNQCVPLIEKMGITVESQIIDHEDNVECIIRFPKV